MNMQIYSRHKLPNRVSVRECVCASMYLPTANVCELQLNIVSSNNPATRHIIAYIYSLPYIVIFIRMV